MQSLTSATSGMAVHRTFAMAQTHLAPVTIHCTCWCWALTERLARPTSAWRTPLCARSLWARFSAALKCQPMTAIFTRWAKSCLARVPLANQKIDPTDSVLGILSNASGKGLKTSYSALIQQAFQPEWWQFSRHICTAADGSTVTNVDPAAFETCPAGTDDYSQMEYNFSLFWGVAIQMYESTLIADQTPFDKYMEQQQTYTLIGDNNKQSYTIQLAPGIQPYSLSIIGLDPLADFTDQEMAYAFDYGDGRVMGVGLDQGFIDYASGTLTVQFGMPPVSTFPIKISYSVGATPMTTGQLRGLLAIPDKRPLRELPWRAGTFQRIRGHGEHSWPSGTNDHGGHAGACLRHGLLPHWCAANRGRRRTGRHRPRGREVAIAIGISERARLQRSLRGNHDPGTSGRRHLHGAAELRRRNSAGRLL